MDGTNVEEGLRRSRRRWRLATAAIAVSSFWLLANAGATIRQEQARADAQTEQIARLEAQLVAAAGQLESTTALLARSRDVIQLFGKQIARQAEASGVLEVTSAGGPATTDRGTGLD